MRKIRAAMQRFEESWLGGLIGVLCLFAIPVLVLFAGMVLEARP